MIHAGEQPVFAGHLGVAYVRTGEPARQRLDREYLEDVLRRVRVSSPGLMVEGTLALGRASDLLVEHSHGAHLLVIGHHGRGPTPEVILGSTARAILRRAHCPVLIVPCGDAAVGAIQHVIVGADGSTLSDAALAWAYDECALWNAPLTIIHGWSYPHHALRTGIAGSRARAEADAASALASAVDRLGAAKGTEVTVEAKLVEGNVADVLHHEAGTADLVVVGGHGRSVVRKLLRGPISASLVDHLPCRVVVVPASALALAPMS